MRSIITAGAATLCTAGVGLPVGLPAHAHGYAGDHLFVSTLLIDDPSVEDEAALPTFSFLPNPADEGGATYNVSFDLSKTITRDLAVSIGSGYTWLTRPGDKTANGWNNLVVGLKYQAYVNDPHEFLLSLGIEQEIPRTGATGANGVLLDNADTGITAPTVYFGKGFGDLPVDLLKPLALTGQLSYEIANKKLKYDYATGDYNNGNANAWSGGLTLQYSVRYLSTHVKDYGFPEFVNRLTPLAEMWWTSAASKPNQVPTQFLWGVGVNYTAETYALTVEALIPGNRNTGSHLGVIAQFHIYLEDLFPRSLGRPIVDWF